MANRRSVDKSWAVAACTVAVAAAVGSSAPAAPETQTVRNLQSYCQTSWRNAGIRRQEWSDCTQQAVVELIERISSEKLDVALCDRESRERRELNRTVWRIIQRWRRSPRLVHFQDGLAGDSTEHAESAWPEIAAAAQRCLSDRQLRILSLIREGWRIPEVADRLKMTTARVSDEKYKAIQKLRKELEIPAPFGQQSGRG